MRTPRERQRLLRKIAELEAASTLMEVSGVTRMVGQRRHYRIRIGDYRLGITMEGDVAMLVRFLSRGGDLPVFSMRGGIRSYCSRLTRNQLTVNRGKPLISNLKGS